MLVYLHRGRVVARDNMSGWKIETGALTAKRQTADASTVPLKWAHDGLTGEARYVHDPAVAKLGRACTCPAWDLSLIPATAGEPLRVRPTAHFRHPAGAQQNDLSLVAARHPPLAQEPGVIELPRRRLSHTAQGFSGDGARAMSPVSRRI